MSSFRNVVFPSYLEVRTKDKVHKPSDSEQWKHREPDIRKNEIQYWQSQTRRLKERNLESESSRAVWHVIQE
jgi:hypothetical protein